MVELELLPRTANKLWIQVENVSRLARRRSAECPGSESLSEEEDNESYLRRKMMVPRSPEEAERFTDLNRLEEERDLESIDDSEEQLREEMGLAPRPSEEVLEKPESGIETDFEDSIRNQLHLPWKKGVRQE